MSPVGNAAVLAARIPGASVALIEGAPHGYVDEVRDEALLLVMDFLRAHKLR
jgi:hypothetical protein